ncbi:MAG: dienelactone hydrolase family protein [Rhodospirillales bacterium]
MGEMISFACPDGSSADGYLATADGSRMAVIVLQEWWGLNEQIKRTCDHFADEGITALAPDLYEGRVTQEPDEAEHMMTGLDWVGATETDVGGALAHLRAGYAKVGVMGFCMGGALTIISAVKLPVDAAVCYYGIPPKDAADPAAIGVPFQGHFATDDDWCTPDAAAALETDLQASGTIYEMFSYKAAHGFFNDTVAAYNSECATLSWARTTQFLHKHLG